MLVGGNLNDTLSGLGGNLQEFGGAGDLAEQRQRARGGCRLGKADPSLMPLIMHGSQSLRSASTAGLGLIAADRGSRGEKAMLRQSLIAAASIAFLVSAAGAQDDAGQGTWMDEAEIRAAFAGQTIDGHYSNGDAFTESYLANGRIDYREKVRKLTGRWSVEAGTFCTIYDASPTGGCYRVRRMSGNCFEFYYVGRDESEVLVRPGRPAWTARGWHKNKNSTCEEAANV